jgi:hypothetical protein
MVIMTEALKVDQEGQEWLKGILHNPEEKVTVVFTKKDGTERTMNCTLAESLIPASMKPSSDKTYTPNQEVQAVFDLDAQGWRSFRWDSLKEIQVSEA